MHHVVTLGGGTGHAQVLKALKNIADVTITGICPGTDSGGSSGILEREYGGSGYTGDLTKCIVALAEHEQFAKALLYRYEHGPLHGHSVKNILFNALEQVTDKAEALLHINTICGLGNHKVLPATIHKTELCAALTIGNTIVGETTIDTIAKNPLWNPHVHSISNIFLRPEVAAYPEAVTAISEASHIVVCPGDLYSSIIPTLLPQGMTAAMRASSAPVTVILNIMTKQGETDDYAAHDFIEKIETHLGRPATYIVYNDAPIPEHILLKYSLERKVELGLLEDTADPRMIKAPLALVTPEEQIYTDPAALRTVLIDILSRTT